MSEQSGQISAALSGERWRELQTVLGDVRALRRCGEQPSDEEVERRYAHLMPELRAGLQLLPSLEKAEGKTPQTDAGGAVANDPIARILQSHLPRYCVMEQTSHGAQGAVYKAERLDDGAFVAIKVLDPPLFASERSHRRFQHEIDIIARLDHPHIVEMIEHGSVGNCHYFIMPFVHGVPIDEHVELFEPSLQERLELFVKVCRAVAAAHRMGIIHRDLKPSNIFVDADGEPMILDFGLADLIDRRDGGDGDGWMVPASVGFLSPEQVSPDYSQIDTRSDVYSAGVLLYVVLTGTFPYNVYGPPSDALRHIAEDKPMRLREAIRNGNHTTVRRPPRLDAEIEAIVFKALEKEPERRYQSCTALADDLQRYLDGRAVSVLSGHRWHLTKRFVLRHKAGIALATVLVIVAILGWSQYQLEQQRQQWLAQRHQASREAELDAHGDAVLAAGVMVAPEQLADMTEAQSADYYRWVRLPVRDFDDFDAGTLAGGPTFFFGKLREGDEDVESQTSAWLDANRELLDAWRGAFLANRVRFREKEAPFEMQPVPLFDACRIGSALVARAFLRLREGDVELDQALLDLRAARSVAYSLEQGMTFENLQQGLTLRSFIAMALLDIASTKGLNRQTADFILSEIDVPRFDVAWHKEFRSRLPYLSRAVSPTSVDVDPIVDLRRLDFLLVGYLSESVEKHGGNLGAVLRQSQMESAIQETLAGPRGWQDMSLADVDAEYAAWRQEFTARVRRNPMLYSIQANKPMICARTNVRAARRVLRLAAFYYLHGREAGMLPPVVQGALTSARLAIPDDPITGEKFDIQFDGNRLIVESASIESQAVVAQTASWFKAHPADDRPNRVRYLTTRFDDRAP